MISIQARCDGVFLGHVIASQFDASAQMALQLSESLIELKSFDGSNIMSRYLYFYHTKRCDLGETMKVVYQSLKDKMKNNHEHSPVCREDFIFDRSIIDETVRKAHNKLNGFTAGCGPAHRSFPLALYPGIADDDLFDISKKESILTHYSPLAGQVAGVVNLICRSLLRNCTWYDAVQSAFLSPSLHPDMNDVQARYSRSPTLTNAAHPGYAPAVLCAALYYISSSSSTAEAIQRANAGKNFHCLPITGVLSGALWGVPVEMYQGIASDVRFKIIRDTADKLSNQWTAKHENVHA